MVRYTCGKCREEKDSRSFMPSQRKNGAWCRECFKTINRVQRPRSSRPCGHCGAEMVDPNPKALFCNQQCKNGARIAIDRAARIESKSDRVCANCGTSIAHRRADAKWCSPKCEQKRPTRSVTARRARIKRKYGMTEADYDSMVLRQLGRCAICQSDDPRDPYGKWHIDHDHETGVVRGLLCSRCNTGVGQFRDDPDLLVRAARYVRKSRTTS